MALSNENNKITYTPATSTTEFNFPYPYFDNTDIVVTVEDSLGVITVLTPTTGYAVAATNGDPQNGCTVDTTLTSAYTSGDTVTISREVPYTQEYDLQEGSTIDPTALNTAFDRTVAQSQQLLDESARHITHPITDPAGLSYETPSVTLRSGKATGWDENGNIVALNLADSGTVSGNASAGIDVTNNIISAKVDDSTIGFSSGDIYVKSGGISPTQLATDSVETAKILDANVTTAKIADSNVTLAKVVDLTNYTALGNVSGGAAAPAEVAIINSATMTGAAATNLTSALGVKNYIDNGGGYAPTAYTGEESVTLPNGMIMKTGRISTTTTDTSVSFAVAFPSAIISLSLTSEETGNSVEANPGNIGSTYGVAGFNAKHGSAVDFIHWFAIGY